MGFLLDGGILGERGTGRNRLKWMQPGNGGSEALQRSGESADSAVRSPLAEPQAGPRVAKSGGGLDQFLGIRSSRGFFAMLIDELPRRILASSAATADRKAALHIEQGARSPLHFLTNGAIGDGMTNADVHGSDPQQERRALPDRSHTRYECE